MTDGWTELDDWTKDNLLSKKLFFWALTPNSCVASGTLLGRFTMGSRPAMRVLHGGGSRGNRGRAFRSGRRSWGVSMGRRRKSHWELGVWGGL